VKSSKHLARATAVLGALAVVQPAVAESNFQTGSGTVNATARLDFQITIPKVLYLRVGTGSAYPGTLASVGTVDLITFTVPAASVGSGTAIAGTGGDLSGGVVTAAVIGNNGTITLNAAASRAPSNGAGDSIAYTQIVATPSTPTSATALAAPTLANGTSANVTISPPSGKVVVRDARWTYSYANTVTPAAGTYGGVNVNNGRVTYTASMP
jgi:hypothetical protein